MQTNELLACIRPGTEEYIQETVNTKSKADYQKLKKLFDEQYFEAKSFEDSKLDILTFDWQSPERDRNWWWQLQALPFLNWYANSFSLQSKNERTRYLSLCIDAIHNWISKAQRNNSSPLVWHDHASAYRVRNLTNWLVLCHVSGIALGSKPGADVLADLITVHLDWLQEDKHYSKHTNHGFDQSMIALTIASVFASDKFEAYRQRNRERLKDEVAFAFTDEGVHKENSPGYQKMMLARLKQLKTLALLGELVISQMGERYIGRAEAFLRAITLPNGYLPMVGDTRGGDKGLTYEPKEQIDVLDYSASGYVIVRGSSAMTGDFFLLFKNTHLSDYHRHDDDLMIFLWANGVVLLGDGGLYKHDEKDAKRKFLRSAFAHSIPIPGGQKATRKLKSLKKTQSIVVDIENKVIHGMSYMFGCNVQRILDFSSIGQGIIRLRDRADKSLIQQNFFFYGANISKISTGRHQLRFGSSSILELSSDGQHSDTLSGWSPNGNETSAIASHRYGAWSNCDRLVFGCGHEISTELNFYKI